MKVFEKRGKNQNLKDDCQSPPYAVLPLVSHISKELIIWEPASGEGLLMQGLEEQGYTVISSRIEDGQDFFEYEPEAYDIIVTNPPWSLYKKWMERCFELNKPFALLLPSDKLTNVGVRELAEQHGEFENVTTRGRINFKMPLKGWDATGSQYNTHWYTHGLDIGETFTPMFNINPHKKQWEQSVKTLR